MLSLIKKVEMMKKKFCVLFGRNTTPGVASTSYSIYDVVEFEENGDLEEHMRNYVYKQFEFMGKNIKLLDEDVFCRRRNIVLYDGKVLAERIKIFDHVVSNEFFAMLPIECFAK